MVFIARPSASAASSASCGDGGTTSPAPGEMVILKDAKRPKMIGFLLVVRGFSRSNDVFFYDGLCLFVINGG